MLNELLTLYAQQCADDTEIRVEDLRPCVTVALMERLQETGDWQHAPAVAPALDRFTKRITQDVEDIPKPPYGVLTRWQLELLAEAPSIAVH